MGVNLFQPIVPVSKRHPNFERTRTWPGAEPGRIMANEIFQDFPDTDGNFIEQFQTSGFDARVFELYLFAYLSRTGFRVSGNYAQPDFFIEKDGLAVAIEATTANPRQGAIEALHTPLTDLTEDQLLDKLNNEVPIRFGGPLFTKLRQKYWELDHCKGIPLVFAIETFHEKHSLRFSSNGLAQYLYGLRAFPTWTESGQLIVEYEELEKHQAGDKIIPSNFFKQPNTEFVSAVLFSNCGTFPKFERMGYQAGYHRGNIIMKRMGTCYNTDPNSAEPLHFAYDLDYPPLRETWGQGLEVLHNPNALYPIPRNYFTDAAQLYLEDGKEKADIPGFHPFMSVTENAC